MSEFSVYIPRKVMNYLCNFGMGREYRGDEFLLAVALEERLLQVFREYSESVLGDDISFVLNGKEANILYKRLIYLKNEKYVKEVVAFSSKLKKLVSCSDSLGMNKKKKDLKFDVKTIINLLSMELDKLMRDKYEFLGDNFSVSFKLDWGNDIRYSNFTCNFDKSGKLGRRKSYGCVRLALANKFDENLKFVPQSFIEVDELNSDAVCGGFLSHYWQFYIMALFIHQYSHLLHRYFCSLGYMHDCSDEHGKGFCEIYSYLRALTLNKILKLHDVSVGI